MSNEDGRVPETMMTGGFTVTDPGERAAQEAGVRARRAALEREVRELLAEADRLDRGAPAPPGGMADRPGVDAPPPGDRRWPGTPLREQAGQRVVLGYTDEITGWLWATLDHDPEAVREAFQVFAALVMRKLPSFRWDSSLRTWVYWQVRGARTDYLRDPHGTREEAVTRLSRVPGRCLENVVHWVNTSLGAGTRQLANAFVKMRMEILSKDEQDLLIWRLDEELPWKEVAVLMEGRVLSGKELDRAVNKHKQRYKTLMDKFRREGRRRGLMS